MEILVNRTLLVILVITSEYLKITHQSSCYNSRGGSLCKPKKCKKILKCKGNVAKDACNCCEECMKQENEICGGMNHRFGTCDFNAPFCEQLNGSPFSRCLTYKKALKLGIVKYVKKLTKCIYSRQYKEEFKNRPFQCFLKGNEPAYYCRKNPIYDSSDCCIHGDGCHPNIYIYDKLDTEVLVSALLQKSTNL